MVLALHTYSVRTIKHCFNKMYWWDSLIKWYLYLIWFGKEGRLCSSPIHPQTCQFHSNVSSKFYHQTCATIAPTSRNLVTTVRYEDDFQIDSNYNFFRKNSWCRRRCWQSATMVTRPDKMWNKVPYYPLRLRSCWAYMVPATEHKFWQTLVVNSASIQLSLHGFTD